MATPKRKENSPKKSKKIHEAKDGSTPIRPRRVFEENMTRLQEVTNGSSHEQASYMSLDVLAQVATDKLRDDLKLQPKVTPKKVSKRSIQCLEILNLEQIQSLSNKALLNFFSEMTCNEMTKNFTYQCYLMPDRCQEKFTSFGHETKAKLHMQTHLNNHIEQLTQEANDPERQYRFIFTAEPVHVRNRKLSIKEAEKAKKKKSVSTNNSPINGSNASRVKNNKSFTALKSNKEISRENKAPAPKIIEAEKDLQLPKTCVSRQKNSKISDPTVKFHTLKKNIPTHRYNKRQNPKETLNCRKKLVTKKSICTDNQTTEDAESRGKVTEDSDEKNKETDPYMQIKVNELFIIDLLNKNQPHHDHCYTTIFGKKRPLETAPEEEESDGDTDDQSNSIQKRTKKTIPILELGAKCENGYMVASEEIVSSDGKPKEPESDDEYQSMEAAQPGTSGEQNGNIVAAVHCGQKPYPPMPKSELAKKGKMNVPEEYEEPNSDAEEPTTSRRKKKDTEKSANELERKIAVRCIRELKNRKKDDKIPLVCQICCDKTFTASATLMYHYRSHAGIKPFMCVLCWTTFTRQHSLNYHMLIHNNQSRFTCADCGRKFRHPSHFKEHLRRHTGETPFTCGDCTQKFKTRNTYKRHLKTRHGKLLTANGISVLSNEEFQKVRTKPYKKFNNVKENEPSALLPSPPDVSPESIKCERSNLPTTFTTTSTITTFASSTSIVTTTSTSTSTMTPTASTSTGNSMYVPIEIIVKN